MTKVVAGSGNTLSKAPIMRTIAALCGKTRALRVGTPKSAQPRATTSPESINPISSGPANPSASRNAGPQSPRSALRMPRSASCLRAVRADEGCEEAEKPQSAGRLRLMSV